MKTILALVIGALLATPAFAQSNNFGGAYGGIQAGHSQLETKHTDVYWW